jgi:hypothetical protein
LPFILESEAASPIENKSVGSPILCQLLSSGRQTIINGYVKEHSDD